MGPDQEAAGEAAIRLAGRLVRIKSENPGEPEAEMAACIEGEMKQALEAGAVLERIEPAPGRPLLCFSLAGNGEQPPLVLLGHMDTVPEGEGWTGPAFEGIIREDRLCGRGACDMKGGLACALTAFSEEAQRKRRAPKRELKLICTMDEEGDMRGIEAAIGAGWIGSRDWVMDLEPTGGMIQTAHKSRFWFHLHVIGRAGHASMPKRAADAILAAALAICGIRKRIEALPKDPFLGESTVTFGQIRGGIHPYQVPGACSVTIDLRIVPGISTGQIKTLITEALREAADQVNGIRWELTCTGERPAVAHRPDSPLLALLQRAVLLSEGEEAPVGPFPGYSDSAVAAGLACCENTLSYGPGNLLLAHAPDEYVPLADLRRVMRVLQRLIALSREE